MSHMHSEQPLWPSVLPAMHAAAKLGGNPSSQHRLGQKARRILDDATLVLRQLAHAPKAEVIFTSGATEANTLAICGLARAQRAATGADTVVLQGPTHASVQAAAETLRLEGFHIAHAMTDPERVAVLSVGFVDPATGAISTIPQGIPVHCDAALAPGRVALEMGICCAVSLSARKFGGPPGVGALLLSPGLDLQPLWHGGSQERGLRPGTQAVALIAGMAAAARAVM